MTTPTERAQGFLKGPRLPHHSPVTILHVKADNDRNGNPRRCFAVLTPRGRLVEVLDEGYDGEQEIRARWPWFNHRSADLLKLETAYLVTVQVAPAEYARWIRQGENTDAVDSSDDQLPELRKLREMAARCERWNAVCEALNTVRRDGSGVHTLDGERSAMIYHRTRDNAGDATSVHLARAMRAFVRAGWAADVGGVYGLYGLYRATDTTPRV